jgi:hypothetical protein
MNTIRIFAFTAAVVITVFLFGAIGDGFNSEQPIHAATAAHRSAGAGGPMSEAD